MSLNTATDSSVANDDNRWFTSLSTAELEAHLGSRSILHLRDLPRTAELTLDARAYPGAITAVLGLSAAGLHLLMLSTAAPTAPLAIFFRTAGSLGTTCPAVTIAYDDDAVTFRVLPNDNASLASDATNAQSPRLGDRGVAALSGPAERQWQALSSHISDATLSAAGVTPGTSIHAADSLTSENPSDSTHAPSADVTAPRFAALPRLAAGHGLSPADLTAYHRDRTPFVRTLVCERFAGRFDNLLGEVQLAFVLFARLGFASALEHWARLVGELCQSVGLDDAWVTDLVRVVGPQFEALRETDADAATAVLQGLRTPISGFIADHWDFADVARLAEHVNRLTGWQLCGADDDGDDSDGPVVVDDVSVK